MRVERFPFNWDARARFPAMREIARYYGGVVYEAEADGCSYLIVDESEYVDKLTPGTEEIIYHLIGVHDNTAANRWNPNPKNWVGGGSRSIDEMSFAWVTITYLEENDFQRRVAERKKLQTTQQGSEPGRFVADR